jgi:hypothetical protein
MKSLRRFGQRFEQLERRELMAGLIDVSLITPPPQTGNVTIELVDGTLFVRGDAGSDLVTVISWGDGRYRVGANGRVTANGVDIDAESRVGSEWYLPLTPNGLGEWYANPNLPLAPNGIDIDLGDGDAVVRLQGQGYSTVRIRTGSGDDSLDIDGNTYFPMPDDPITMSIKTVGATTISGDLFVDLGAGQDIATIFALVDGDAAVQMGAGDDVFVEPVMRLPSIYRSPERDPVWRYEIRAKGTRTIDLGSDETPPPMPDNWRDDPKLQDKVFEFILTAFDQYEADLAAGLIAPGAEWSLAKPWDPTYTARINTAGQMKLQFTFWGTSAETIEQLKERGMQFDAYSVDDGVAFVHLREDEFRYFANLPGIISVFTRTPFWDHVVWDYVRPETPAESAPESFPTFGEAVAAPIYGPVRPGGLRSRPQPATTTLVPIAQEPIEADEVASPTLTDDTLSLIDAYYGASNEMGPRRPRRT